MFDSFGFCSVIMRMKYKNEKKFKDTKIISLHVKLEKIKSLK